LHLDMPPAFEIKVKLIHRGFYFEMVYFAEVGIKSPIKDYLPIV